MLHIISFALNRAKKSGDFCAAQLYIKSVVSSAPLTNVIRHLWSKQIKPIALLLICGKHAEIVIVRKPIHLSARDDVAASVPACFDRRRSAMFDAASRTVVFFLFSGSEKGNETALTTAERLVKEFKSSDLFKVQVLESMVLVSSKHKQSAEKALGTFVEISQKKVRKQKAVFEKSLRSSSAPRVLP